MKQKILHFDDIFCFNGGKKNKILSRPLPYRQPPPLPTKTILKRLKTKADFSYDLDKLGFTIGRNSHPSRWNTKVLKKPQKFIEQCCQNKECYNCHGGVFKKASPEELLYRDLFVKTQFLEKTETCSICLHSFSQKFVWKLSCNHYFHYKCIEKWSDLENYTCPLCRQQYYYP